jgi:hypothetical protein
MEEYQKRYILRVEEEAKFKIYAENKANDILNDLTPQILKVFKDLKQGEQILKKGFSVTYGELLKKYKNQVDKIINSFLENYNKEEINPNIYLSCSEYFIYINLKLRFNNLKKDKFVYYDKNKYILNLKEGNLNNLYDFEKYGQINEEEQINILKNCFKLDDDLKREKEKLKLYSLMTLIK